MFQLLAGALAFFYSLVQNYAVAITLLTLLVMLVLSPLTLKSTRSMLAMQKLQPEMKRLQAEHKGDRQKLNEEVMALYREHKVNPVAGCLPLLLQMPVFFVMYRVIHGLTQPGKGGTFEPKYLDKTTDLYHALKESGGKMVSFGVDLAKSATSDHGSFLETLPFFVIIAAVIVTQYVQTRQSMARNTSAANPQQQMMLKVLPGFFGVISLGIPAGVNVYILVSALLRIAQTKAMYRFDPALRDHVRTHAAEMEAKATEVPKGARQAKSKALPPARGGKGAAKPAKPEANGKPPTTSGRATPPKAGGGNGRRPPSRPPQKRRSKKGR